MVPKSTAFVSVKDGRFVGANMWYAAHLGADAAFGNRPRLCRELDRLSELGVTNLRILAASEVSPLKDAVSPASHERGEVACPELLAGLDFALAEMHKRGQRAVLYLTNFWEWSGGMMTYLYWTNGGTYLDMNDPAHPWPEFPDAVARFYGSLRAVELYHERVRSLVTRTNSLTGVRYVDDGAIFSWQLANEPRPGVSKAVAAQHIDAYCAWIQDTARLIKSLDPNHLVSTGSEGLVGAAEQSEYFLRAHNIAEVDYLTAHIWPQNWGWISPDDVAGTFAVAERKTRAYLTEHIDLAERLKRPLVIEEFGFPRDGGGLERASTTTYRNRFYALIHAAVEASVQHNGPLSGSNFWAWGGEGVALHADFRMRSGETNYLGDPTHEPQGWYSVFETDGSTCDAISAHARALGASTAELAPEIPRVFRPQRALPTDVVRPTRAVIDLDHLRHNLHVLRQLDPKKPLWAVLKADAYGHGAKAVARTLERAGIDGICVALVEEGVELREAGVKVPVLVMGGYYGDAYGELRHHELTVVLQDPGQLEALALAVRRHDHKPFSAHLKLDTGMARLGARERDWPRFARALSAYPEVQFQGLMTHLACADSEDDSALAGPLADFERAIQLFADNGHRPAVRHVANSAAYFRGTSYDLARPGIALFGVSPFGRAAPKTLRPEAALALTRLRPVMSLVSRIVAIRDLEPGDSVGYGGTFRAVGPTRVATVPLGYADGFGRAFSNGGEMLVRGQRAAVIGTVSMDMTTIDVTSVLGVALGDDVTVLGDGSSGSGGEALTALELAERSKTIAWEVLTNISRRVPRFYLGA